MLPVIAYAQIEDVRAAFDARHLVAYLVAAFLISVFIHKAELNGTAAKIHYKNFYF